jgi:hypothetical protein
MRFPVVVHSTEFQEAAYQAIQHGKSQGGFARERGVSLGTVCRALAARRERLGLPREQKIRRQAVKFHQLEPRFA